MVASNAPDPSLAERQAQWGARIRQLRREKGVSLNQIVAAMDQAGFRWSLETVSSIQIGRGRTLRPDEALILARLFDVPYEDLIAVPAPEDTPPPKRGRPRVGEFNPERSVGDTTGGHSDAFPKFVGGPGQRARVAKLAEAAGTKPPAILREAIEIGVAALEDHYGA